MPLKRDELARKEQEQKQLQNHYGSQILEFLSKYPDQLFTIPELKKRLPVGNDSDLTVFLDVLYALVQSGQVEVKTPDQGCWSGDRENKYGLAGAAQRIDNNESVAHMALKNRILDLFRHDPDTLFTVSEVLEKVSMPIFFQSQSRDAQIGYVVTALLELRNSDGPIERKSVGIHDYYGLKPA